MSVFKVFKIDLRDPVHISTATFAFITEFFLSSSISSRHMWQVAESLLSNAHLLSTNT